MTPNQDMVNIDKMSFAEVEEGKQTIKNRKALDVSVVDTPAYDSTSIYARSLESMDVELKAMELEEKQHVEVMKKEDPYQNKLLNQRKRRKNHEFKKRRKGGN